MKRGDTVYVDSVQCENSLVTHNFQGTVTRIHSKDKLVDVIDQDEDVFTVAPKSLTVIED